MRSIKKFEVYVMILLISFALMMLMVPQSMGQDASLVITKLETDKAIYSPGDYVTIFSGMQNDGTDELTNFTSWIEIQAPFGFSIYDSPLSELGVILQPGEIIEWEDGFSLPTYAPPGTYTVTLNVSGVGKLSGEQVTASGTFEFTVENFVFLGVIGGAVGIGAIILLIRILAPKPKSPKRPKVETRVKSHYFNMTIRNDSENSIDDVEVSLKISKPSFLVKIITKSHIKKKMVQVGSLKPEESTEIDFVTAIAQPKIKVTVPLSAKKPTLTVRYKVQGEQKEYQMKPDMVVFTDERIFMMLKLQFDLDNEIVDLKKEFNIIKELITSRKIRFSGIQYNVLTVQNGSKEPISDLKIVLEVPATQTLVGDNTFSIPVIKTNKTEKIRFSIINPELKDMEMLEHVKAKIQYQLMGKTFDIKVEARETVKTPENIITEIKVYDLETRIGLLETLRNQIKL